MAFYTSDLIAYLAVPSKPRYIRNVDELVSQTETKPIIKYGGSVYTLFKVNISRGRYTIFCREWSNSTEMTSSHQYL
jgi:hypothetical protein